MEDYKSLWEEYAQDNNPIDMSTFVVKESLNSDIWDEDLKLRDGIRERLETIALNFFSQLNLPPSIIRDIIVTGSLANYNWSQFSDIDLHILVDFADINKNEELVREYFKGHTSNWNNRHNIKMRGFEVEIYVQDIDEPHVSTGIYSLLEDDWLVTPRREEPEIDFENAAKKAERLMQLIDSIEDIYQDGRYEDAEAFATLTKEKIKKFRKCGLEAAGEYSPENIAFKALRRNGYLKKLFDIALKSYDNTLSVTENHRRNWQRFCDNNS